jgi:hypothetical protein
VLTDFWSAKRLRLTMAEASPQEDPVTIEENTILAPGSELLLPLHLQPVADEEEDEDDDDKADEDEDEDDEEDEDEGEDDGGGYSE